MIMVRKKVIKEIIVILGPTLMESLISLMNYVPFSGAVRRPLVLTVVIVSPLVPWPTLVLSPLYVRTVLNSTNSVIVGTVGYLTDYFWMIDIKIKISLSYRM